MTISKGEIKLLVYFLRDLAERMGNAGCNEMDQKVFAGISDDDKMALYGAWLIADQTANPTDWEARRFQHIPDLAWVHLLADRIEERDGE